MALVDAGFKMRDIPVAVAAGVVNNEVVVDLCYDEEATEGAVDLPIGILPRTKEITLLQMDGKIKKEKLMEALEVGKKVSEKLHEILRGALKERYEGNAAGAP